MESADVQLTITIEAGADPIAGRIQLAGGAERDFNGYLQLVAALESAREAAGPVGRRDRDLPNGPGASDQARQ